MNPNHRTFTTRDDSGKVRAWCRCGWTELCQDRPAAEERARRHGEVPNAQ